MGLTTVPAPLNISRRRFAAHLSLLRLDHSVKQIFVIPGIVIAASLTATTANFGLFWRIAIGMTAIVAVASSNYVLNEILDAPFDRQHPTKCVVRRHWERSASHSPTCNGWFALSADSHWPARFQLSCSYAS